MNLLGALEATLGAHEALAAGANERIGTSSVAKAMEDRPDLQYEIPPEGAEVAGAALGRGGHGVRSGGIDAGFPRADFEAPGFVGVATVVANRVLVFRGDVLDGGGEEVGGGEDLKIPPGAPTGARAVDDALGFLDPGDLFEGEGGAQQVFRELLASAGGADGAGSGVEAESAVFPGEKLQEPLFADESFSAKDREKAVAEREIGRASCRERVYVLV